MSALLVVAWLIQQVATIVLTQQHAWALRNFVPFEQRCANCSNGLHEVLDALLLGLVQLCASCLHLVGQVAEQDVEAIHNLTTSNVVRDQGRTYRLP